MARKYKPLQQYRGTTEKSEAYTGPEGEFTMDLDTKQIRVHDGIKAGGYLTALDSNVVHKTEAETVNGTKTFGASPLVPDVPASDSSTKSANTAFVTGAVQAAVNKSVAGVDVSGTTMTVTFGDGSTVQKQTQDTTYNPATTTVDGLMSAADKAKLAGIEDGATAYSLPTASVSTLGGVKVGTNLSILNGVLSATDTTYSVATTTSDGLMSSSDKDKLNSVEAGAQVNTITGVKGNAETAYRTGDVNITLANIGAASATHTHVASDVTSGTFAAARIPNLDASKITTGTIDIARLPAAALERLVQVTDSAARLALTSDKVQVGDTVKQTSDGRMFYVVDDTKLNSEDGYVEYTVGSASSVPWSGVTDKPTTATSTTDGFMSASDKSKLDGITASAASVAFSRSITSGTKIGTITINGTGTDIYTPSYTAATNGGLSLSSYAFSLANSGVTAGSYGPSADVAPGSGGTFTVPYVTVDAKGRVTGAKSVTVTMPTAGSTVSFSRSLTSGTKVGTITIDGTATDIYCQTNTNTTYSAASGGGLTLSGTAFSIANTVTAGSVGPSANATLTFGGTFTVPQVTYNAKGQITGVATRTMTMPANPNTHYTTKLIAGTSTSTANAAATNGNLYLRLFDDTTARNSLNIKGTGSVTVVSDANGVITINGTDNNTDTKVTQTASSTSVTGVYPILFKNTTATATVTDSSRFSTLVTVDPSSGQINARLAGIGIITPSSTTIGEVYASRFTSLSNASGAPNLSGASAAMLKVGAAALSVDHTTTGKNVSILNFPVGDYRCGLASISNSSELRFYAMSNADIAAGVTSLSQWIKYDVSAPSITTGIPFNINRNMTFNSSTFFKSSAFFERSLYLLMSNSKSTYPLYSTDLSVEETGVTDNTQTYKITTSMTSSIYQYILWDIATDYTVSPRASFGHHIFRQSKTAHSIGFGLNGHVLPYNSDWANYGTVNNDSVGGGWHGICFMRNSTAIYFGPNSLQNNKMIDLGANAAANRWNNLYISNAPVVASDARLKNSIDDVPDEVLDAWETVPIRQYKLNQRHRTHIGGIAQEVMEKCREQGVDITKYGIVCDGSPVINEETGEEEEPAYYSLRYEEFLCLEAACQRRRASRLEARVKELEDKLAQLLARD